MRELRSEELRHVSGGWKSCSSGKHKQGNNGYGNGGHDGVPGRSGKQDCTR